MEYHIEKHNLSDVLSFGKERYNSNNHHDVQPPDYWEKVSETNTRHWIKQFHKSYLTVEIDLSKNKWIFEANNVGSLLKRVSPLYEEDLNDLADSLGVNSTLPVTNKGYFVRSEHVSLKGGIHGVGPYTSFKQILESIITARAGHSPLEENSPHSEDALHSEDRTTAKSATIKLYLLPWVEIFQEFRVFVYKGRITAISQQNLYRENNYLKNRGDPEKIITGWCDLICDYFSKTVKDKIHINSYCIDFAILQDGSPYFIEINPFGKEYASGSALFHWLHDEDILYGKEDKIHVRYV